MKPQLRDNNPSLIEFKERLGRNIKLLRRVCEMTGEQFAKYLGVSRTHLYLLENGKSLNIRCNALYRIGKEIELDSFFKKEISQGIIENRHD